MNRHVVEAKITYLFDEAVRLGVTIDKTPDEMIRLMTLNQLCNAMSLMEDIPDIGAWYITLVVEKNAANPNWQVPVYDDGPRWDQMKPTLPKPSYTVR